MLIPKNKAKPRVGPLLLLSREHHHSLVMARDARRAADNNDATILAAAVARMENHSHAVMAAHFEQEERLIGMAEDILDPESVAEFCPSIPNCRGLSVVLVSLGQRRACAGSQTLPAPMCVTKNASFFRSCSRIPVLTMITPGPTSANPDKRLSPTPLF
jgi:hypothetical protein